LFQIAAIPDAETYLDRLGEEDAFSRALYFSEIAIAVDRILGSTAKLSLSDWERDYDGPQFAVHRKVPWDHGVARVAREKITSGTEERVNLERMRHGARRVVSVIDIPLGTSRIGLLLYMAVLMILVSRRSLRLDSRIRKPGSRSLRAGTRGRRKLAK
jgi:hypothetical protein